MNYDCPAQCGEENVAIIDTNTYNTCPRCKSKMFTHIWKSHPHVSHEPRSEPKTPLGVQSKEIHREKRMSELARAIHEYLEHAPLLDNHVSINEWVSELKELSDEYTGVKK